jgi:hypothetical protein
MYSIAPAAEDSLSSFASSTISRVRVTKGGEWSIHTAPVLDNIENDLNSLDSECSQSRDNSPPQTPIGAPIIDGRHFADLLRIKLCSVSEALASSDKAEGSVSATEKTTTSISNTSTGTSHRNSPILSTRGGRVQASPQSKLQRSASLILEGEKHHPAKLLKTLGVSEEEIKEEEERNRRAKALRTMGMTEAEFARENNDVRVVSRRRSIFGFFGMSR